MKVGQGFRLGPDLGIVDKKRALGTWRHFACGHVLERLDNGLSTSKNQRKIKEADLIQREGQWIYALASEGKGWT